MGATNDGYQVLWDTAWNTIQHKCHCPHWLTDHVITCTSLIVLSVCHYNKQVWVVSKFSQKVGRSSVPSHKLQHWWHKQCNTFTRYDNQINFTWFHLRHGLRTCSFASATSCLPPLFSCWTNTQIKKEGKPIRGQYYRQSITNLVEH